MLYPEIEKVVSQLNKIVDVVTVQPIATDYAHNPHNLKESVKHDFLPSSEDEAAVREKIRKLAKLYPSLNSRYFKGIPDYWFHREKLLKVKCWSPFLRLRIMPDGKVIHCIANARYGAVGDLKDMTLMDAWNSSVMKRHREEIRKHCQNCICWTQDTSYNALLDSLPLINKLPIFNKRNL